MKTGRNAPCLCGSGKKFKRCCWRAAQFTEAKLNDLENREWEERQAAMSPEDRKARRRRVHSMLGVAGLLGAVGR